ncbi:MAG: winged helix-turn-helix domain-containing protein [Vicinamibacterales bacterium]|nr:winged helix-turn-helix domain-containing protein [Vicinamibacterales bacterium]
MQPAPVFQWGEWTFEPSEWRLTSASGRVVSLPNKSLELLALLLVRAPGLVSKDEILGTVWRDAVVEEGNIAFHIAALRKALDAPGGGASCIGTVRGRGYRFVAAVTHKRSEAGPAVAPEPGPTAPALAPAGAAVTPAGTPAPAVAPRTTPNWLFPAALLVAAASLLVWLAIPTTETRVREVAVLPVRAAGDSAVVEGLAEAIAAQLARQTTLPTQMATGGAPGESALEAGRRLQADTVLTTTVDRSRDPWRVTVQLTRTRDQRQLWASVFDVPPVEPVVGIAIGARVAGGLGRRFDVLATEGPPGGVNQAAFDLFVQGRELWRLRTPHSVQQAIVRYEQAIAIEPAFARAYAGLADCYNLTLSGLPAEVRHARAKAHAEHALALDPGLAEAHTSLAFLRYKFEWRWRDAEAAFRRAIEADPSYALAHHWYGEMLGLLGRYDEAIAELRRARALEPNALAIDSDLVPPLLRAGRVAEARAVVEAAAAANPNWHWVPRRMAEVLAAEGRERESLEEHWRALVLSGATLDWIEALREAYRAGGLPAVLRLEIAQLEAAEATSPGGPQNATFLSLKYARLGERGEALRWIATALDRREDAAIHLLTHPDYDSLRGDPAFQRLLERVGVSPPQS